MIFVGVFYCRSMRRSMECTGRHTHQLALALGACSAYLTSVRCAHQVKLSPSAESASETHDTTGCEKLGHLNHDVTHTHTHAHTRTHTHRFGRTRTVSVCLSVCLSVCPSLSLSRSLTHARAHTDSKCVVNVIIPTHTHMHTRTQA